MKWHRWAHRLLDNDQQVFYMNFEKDQESLKFYYLDDPIVHLELTEGPEGQYWGWVETNSEEVSRVQPHRSTFTMEFYTHNPEAEAKDGKGRIVRLTVHEIHEG